jgi:[ribosomal protein S5]-alanine N-acetyltransferase
VSTRTVERFETARMVCERVALDQAPEHLRLLLDTRVSRTLWPRRASPTAAEILDGLAAKVEHWERHGFGMWLLRDRETGEMVGRGGLQHTYTAALNDIEAGWAIVPERWGQGLATELAHACVEVGFEQLDLLEIIAFTQPTNVASRRVMEKAGFEYERNIMHAGLPHVLYRRRRER